MGRMSFIVLTSFVLMWYTFIVTLFYNKMSVGQSFQVQWEDFGPPPLFFKTALNLRCSVGGAAMCLPSGPANILLPPWHLRKSMLEDGQCVTPFWSITSPWRLWGKNIFTLK
jgi:hypothetical protein